MTAWGFYAAMALDLTPSDSKRKGAARTSHPCFGGCGADVKRGRKYCPPCSDMAREERKRIYENGRHRERGARA